MVPLMSLWMPILLSAVLVFVVSSIIHMLLGYHASDFGAVPKEEEVAESMRKAGISPGNYVIPHCKDPKEMQSEAHVEKMKKGPVVFMTVAPSGPPAMGGALVKWFLYSVLVSIFVAYLTGRALGPGTEYLRVFQISGCAAFMAYSLAFLQDSIWLSQPWSVTLKSVFDGLLYGLVTAGAFGWLWPGV